METKNLLSAHGDKFLNITKTEWVRVFPAFFIKLIFQVALLSGGTILTALFINEFSIGSLPILFIIQALLVMFGTTIVAGFLRKYSPGKLISLASFVASLLFLSASVFFADIGILFFPVLIFSLSVLLAQISIWLSLFIENLFSPLEGERVIPIIESSEPIGGIVSGLFIISLVEKISVLNMLMAVGFLMLCIPFLMMFSIRKVESIPVLRVRRERRIHEREEQNMFSNAVRFFRKNRFITGLFAVVFFTFFVLQLLEYNYMRAVDDHVRHSDEYIYGPQAGHSMSHADALMHNFGEIQIIIFSALFCIQVLFASRILRFFGVMKTYALAPLFSFFSFAGMFFYPGFLSTMIAKGVFEISSGIGRNAFLTSFYALREDLRDEAKEVIEGIGKPLGLLFGTLALLGLEILMPLDKISPSISMAICLASAISLFIILHLRKEYTRVSKKKLDSQVNLPEKMNAIEILSQKGHRFSTDYLVETLRSKNELPEVKVKILKVIGFLEDENAIPAILNCFHDNNREIRLAAVKALGKYKHLGRQFFSQAFSVYSVQSALKKLFMESKSTSLKVAAIKVFANLKDPEIIPFLIKVLRSKDPEIRAESASVCGMFHDSGTICHLEPLLKDKSSRVKSAAIIALWQFAELRTKLIEKMTQMLDSKNETEFLAGVYAIGETQSVQERERLLQLLQSKNQRIRRHAAIALGKMNEKSVTEHIVEFLFHKEKAIGIKTKRMVRGVHKNVRKTVEHRSMQEAIIRVSNILQKSKTSILENLENSDLHELLHLFHLIDAEREIWKIRMILSERGEVKPVYQ